MRVCQGLGPFAILFLLFCAMVCAQDPHPPKLIESENRRDIRDEPIFKPGSPVTVASPKNIPPAPPNEEPSLIDGVKWHDTESISLAAQKKKVITVEVDSRSWLLVKVDWHGAGVPVQDAAAWE